MMSPGRRNSFAPSSEKLQLLPSIQKNNLVADESPTADPSLNEPSNPGDPLKSNALFKRRMTHIRDKLEKQLDYIAISRQERSRAPKFASKKTHNASDRMSHSPTQGQLQLNSPSLFSLNPQSRTELSSVKPQPKTVKEWGEGGKSSVINEQEEKVSSLMRRAALEKKAEALGAGLHKKKLSVDHVGLMDRSNSLAQAPVTFAGAESQRFLPAGFNPETAAFKHNKVEHIEHQLLVDGQKRIANSVRNATPDKYKNKMENILSSDPLTEFDADIKKQ